MTGPLLTTREVGELLGVKRIGLGALHRDPCAYCGLSIRDDDWREVDHIHPRSEGGESCWTNYTAACGACNVLKSATSALVWLSDLGALSRGRLPERLIKPGEHR